MWRCRNICRHRKCCFQAYEGRRLILSALRREKNITLQINCLKILSKLESRWIKSLSAKIDKLGGSGRRQAWSRRHGCSHSSVASLSQHALRPALHTLNTMLGEDKVSPLSWNIKKYCQMTYFCRRCCFWSAPDPFGGELTIKGLTSGAARGTRDRLSREAIRTAAIMRVIRGASGASQDFWRQQNSSPPGRR